MGQNQSRFKDPVERLLAYASKQWSEQTPESISKNAVIFGMLASAALASFLKYMQFKKSLEKESKQSGASQSSEHQPKKKASGRLDATFFKRLKLLLSIVIPSWKSLEVVQLIALATVVISRTFVSNWLSSISGDISQTLIELDFRTFCARLGLSTSLSFVSALLAPALKFLTSKLALEWRISLTKYIHKQYLTNMMYYKTANLNSDIPNPDQIITQDVEKFCDGMTGLFANLVKPIADVCLYTYKLVSIAGYGGPIAILGYMFLSFLIITFVRPPFSALTSKYQNLEGNFRYCHIRTATNGESIAFYGGDALEKSIVDASFDELYHHKHKLIKSHLFFGIFNDLFVFNLPQSVSWIIAMMPVFFGDLRNASRGELAKHLRYLAAVISHEFQAIGEIIHLNTRLTEIAGYTTNVCKLLETIDKIRDDEKNGKKGTIEKGETIKFENVTLTTPDGKLLAKNMTFEVPLNQNILITGPNGAGKSSLFRVLGGLWPITDGNIKKPGVAGKGLSADIYYVPQRPYNAVGTLRDNITYPETVKSDQVPDEKLMECLKMVRIDYLVEREGGFNIVKNWDDILSLGEQQRLSMARLFYHKPKYAILDECTSAVSVDIEKKLYELCGDLGITCITISLRPALKPFHDFELSLETDDHGNLKGDGWKLEKIVHEQHRPKHEPKKTFAEAAATATTTSQE